MAVTSDGWLVLDPAVDACRYAWSLCAGGEERAVPLTWPLRHRRRGPLARPRPAAHAALRIPGPKTVLVVDDHADVRAVVARALERSGYAVLRAADGEEALRIAAGHAGTIHLVLTDVVMPGIGGRELGLRLTRLRPGLKVLYMSGSPTVTLARAASGEEPPDFLQKPFLPTALVRKVDEAVSR